MYALRGRAVALSIEKGRLSNVVITAFLPILIPKEYSTFFWSQHLIFSPL